MNRLKLPWGRLFLVWQVVWVLMLSWWWSTWLLFNLGRVTAGVLIGIGVPAGVTTLALAGMLRRSTLGGDNE